MLHNHEKLGIRKTSQKNDLPWYADLVDIFRTNPKGKVHRQDLRNVYTCWGSASTHNFNEYAFSHFLRRNVPGFEKIQFKHSYIRSQKTNALGIRLKQSEPIVRGISYSLDAEAKILRLFESHKEIQFLKHLDLMRKENLVPLEFRNKEEERHWMSVEKAKWEEFSGINNEVIFYGLWWLK